MSRFQCSITLGILLLGLCLQIGCRPQQPLYLFEKGQYQKHLITKATGIEYPDTEVTSLPETCQTIEPLTLDNPNPTDYWDLTLEEALQIALKNSKVVRTLNGVSFSKAGVSGTPGTALSSPTLLGTVYDPALMESDPRYGIEAALSAFDGQFNAGVSWTKSDMPADNIIPGQSGQSDRGDFSAGISKVAATGGQFSMTHVNTYFDNPAYRDFPGMRSGWATYLEGAFTQPLLQGNGIQFNRIAGPGATPGFYNGVVIARIKSDMTIVDFEMAARNLVADVEKAYWNLYYAYHQLESVKSGRDSAHQTWSKTYAMYIIGARGGGAKDEAQARNNYFSFRSQTEAAQSNLFKTENTLRYILGLAATDGRLIRPIDEPIIAPLNLDFHSILCESLIRSPELRKQKWDVKSKEMELIAAKNFLLPRLDFVAKYRWDGAGQDLLPQSSWRTNAYDSMTGGDYQGWMMGLNASVPFGWRKELAGVRNAQLALAKSRALLQEQELELTHQITDSIRELHQTYQLSRTQLQRRIAAQDEVSAVDAAYTAGTTTLDQLLQAQQRQAEAETDYYRSVVDYNLGIMALHYRKGSLLEYDNVCLSEGPWPNKAYFDAKNRARGRDASKKINYAFTRPRVVSRGHYHQFQNAQSFEIEKDFNSPQSVPTPVSEPMQAPPPPPTIETQTRTDVPPRSIVPDVVPAVGSSVPAAQPLPPANTPVSFTTPMAPKTTPAPTTSRSNRYIDSELPPL